MDQPRLRDHARGWAVPGRQVQCGEGGQIRRSAPAGRGRRARGVCACKRARDGGCLWRREEKVGSFLLAGFSLPLAPSSFLFSCLSPLRPALFFLFPPPPTFLRGSSLLFLVQTLKGSAFSRCLIENNIQANGQRRESVWGVEKTLFYSHLAVTGARAGLGVRGVQVWAFADVNFSLTALLAWLSLWTGSCLWRWWNG